MFKTAVRIFKSWLWAIWLLCRVNSGRLGFQKTKWAWWSLLTNSVCPASVCNCVARAQSALWAANNRYEAPSSFRLPGTGEAVSCGSHWSTEDVQDIQAVNWRRQGPYKYCETLKLKMVSEHNHKGAVPSFSEWPAAVCFILQPFLSSTASLCCVTERDFVPTCLAGTVCGLTPASSEDCFLFHKTVMAGQTAEPPQASQGGTRAAAAGKGPPSSLWAPDRNMLSA